MGIGGDHPIRVQSMTITDTRDTQATVFQIKELVEVGCEIVRVTVPSLVEAENLKEIKALLRREGFKVPLVADIHFTPNAALKAVEFVEKVRINPGNFADRKRFEQREYTDREYEQELERLENQFKPLVLKAKTYGVALRIGTNHGSLSDRIMNRFGDTPEGMVESALEFVRICERHHFDQIVLSMKSSNPLVMIQTYRLLAARMAQENMDYPFHLGVTEAGDGEDGRVKSAIGIGSLLEDGIGDTIRVSLTEDPVAEVPVGFQLVQKFNARIKPSVEGGFPSTKLEKENEKYGFIQDVRNPFFYCRRASRKISVLGVPIGEGSPIPVELPVQSGLSSPDQLLKEIIHLSNPWDPEALKADIIEIPLGFNSEVEALNTLKQKLDLRRIYLPLACRVDSRLTHLERAFPGVHKLNFVLDGTLSKDQWEASLRSTIRMAKTFQVPIQWEVGEGSVPGFLSQGDRKELLGMVATFERLAFLCEEEGFPDFLFALNWLDFIGAQRFLVGFLAEKKMDVPLTLRYVSNVKSEALLLDGSVQIGSLLSDGIGDLITLGGGEKSSDALRFSFNLLQATRLRLSKTDFISCPSCGRTLFNLQTTTERIKTKMSHLKGVKIAIMGCIVNGPGEMADADFGYIGSGPQKVDLYVGKDRVRKNVPEERADETLIELIKAQGKWVDPG